MMNLYDRLMRVPGASRERLARIAARRATDVDRLWARPDRILPHGDPWQLEVMLDPVHDWILCASRQSGKTETVAAKVAWEAQCLGSFVLVVSASEAQAFEFHTRTMEAYRRLPLVEPSEPPSKSQLRLANGGRVLCLPNNERTIRVYSSVDLLVIDEAARVPDALFGAVRPMLAVSGGRTILLSTPFGRRGFFHKEWTEGRGWRRQEVPWQRCPRIRSEFVEAERVRLGDAWVAQEFECRFASLVSSPFDVEAMMALERADYETY